MKQKILFIDRDGTLVEEPHDEQVDALEKIRFKPGVFRWLGLLAERTDYLLVMVSNQDGLGTPSFPEETFWPAQNFILQALEGEGIRFDDVLIDPHFPEDNAPTRKPGTGMVQKYIDDAEHYDMANSYVIGDRETDRKFADNIGCKAIILDKQTGWKQAAETIIDGYRRSSVRRTTKETDISVSLALDGQGECHIDTGLGFFDHMLEQIGRHGGIDLDISVKGDLNVDEHHTIEDTALALGECLRQALGSKRGIERYGFSLPMDDCQAHVCLDFGGRPWLIWEATFHRDKIGDMPTEMFFHFFKSLSDAALMNLYIHADGQNEHHKIEAIFKALARSLRQAIRRDVYRYQLPSTKGIL
ncbi:MAG: bifunctional histidinol-phosphatase/imidazoleglycerol-phosphate dehydratase HisB [Prevotella sp.]|nr:bifunctional histidinol-phosphatase/imidazoleglycerol-phosphate dehydratase HisB [Prevotella sp.]